jgi:hypothetical protein
VQEGSAKCSQVQLTDGIWNGKTLEIQGSEMFMHEVKGFEDGIVLFLISTGCAVFEIKTQTRESL